MQQDYRRDVDGLRAIAVIPVILFHAGAPWLPGGFLGVDVFFVISGFLITGLLLRSMDAGHFSYGGFFLRRMRRLLPAAITVMATTTLAAWYLMTPGEIVAYGKSLAAQAVFASNFHFARQSGYFDTDMEQEPLLHMWSLAVEEQFYLLFPPLLLLCTRNAGKHVPHWLLAGLVASFTLCLWLVEHRPMSAFYLLPARSWELLAGAVAAWYVLRHPAPQHLQHGGRVALGLTLIIASMVLVDGSMPHPAWPTLLPVIGTLLVLVHGSGSTASLAGRLLSSRPMVGIGLISYSLYLWHQPLLALPKHMYIVPPPWWIQTAAVLTSVLLAWLTWATIERHFRYQAQHRTAIVFTAIMSVLLLAIGLVMRQGDGLTPFNRHHEFARRHLNDLRQDGKPCHARREAPCIFPASAGRPTVFLVGDSHVGALAPQLHERLQSHGIGVVDLTRSGCHFAVQFHREDDDSRCTAAVQQERFAYLLASPPGIVLLHGRLPMYLDGHRYVNQGVHESGDDAPFVSADFPADSAQRPEALRADIIDGVSQLLAHGHRLLLVYPVPEVAANVPAALYKKNRFNLDDFIVEAPTTEFRHRSAQAYAIYDAIVGDEIVRVYPEQLFCSAPPGACSVLQDGRQLYFDDNHLSAFGAGLLSDQVVSSILAAGWLEMPGPP